MKLRLFEKRSHTLPVKSTISPGGSDPSPEFLTPIPVPPMADLSGLTLENDHLLLTDPQTLGDPGTHALHTVLLTMTVAQLAERVTALEQSKGTDDGG